MAALLYIAVLLSSFTFSSGAELYPYGVAVGDTEFPPNDDSSVRIDSKFGFIFYNTTYNSYYVNNNGLISFTMAIPSYTPQNFPLPDPMIAPFWADVDTTRPDDFNPHSNQSVGRVWYRLTSDLSIVLRVRNDVMEYGSEANFIPNEVLIATWDQVGYYDRKTDKNNTFQCVLATNGISSYTMFLYPENGINWYSGDASGGTGGLGGTPALIGFNKGDGIVSFSLDESFTPQVLDVWQESNVGGEAGFYLWNVNNITDGKICKTNYSSIIISPNSGHELGGTVVIVKGPCFTATDIINCIFGHLTVPGVVVNENRALCVSPMFGHTASPVEFKLQVNNSNSNPVNFYLKRFTDLADVRMIANNSQLLVQGGDSIKLEWNNASLFPLADDNFHVSISLYWLKVSFSGNRVISNGSIDYFSTLLTDEPNIGSITATVPILGATEKFVPLSLKVNVNITSPTNDPYQTALYNLYNSGSGDVTTAGIWTHVIVWWDGSTDFCSNWLGMYFDVWTNIVFSPPLPSCPCNTTQADLLNSGFEPNTSPGRRLMDQFLHNGLSICYLSSTPVNISSLNFGTMSVARQECCYDNSGGLVIGAPTGGHELRNIPVDDSTIYSYANEFTDNILPYLACCIKSSDTNHCSNIYYSTNHRPSNDCTGFTQPDISYMYGDPHLQTLDGVQYTFNGRGEFILVQTIDNRLTIQGRMVQLTTTDDDEESQGTVFSSIVAKQNNSDTVEFQYNFIGLIVLVNGDWVTIDTQLPGHFTHVTIRNKGNNRYGAIFSSGAYIEVKQESGFLALVGISLPDSYKTITDGLLGHYDGQILNDLVSREGQNIPRIPTIEDIHYEFGMTWIITNASESLFTYSQQDNFYTYYYPDFTPTFQPNFTNSTLQQEAEALCQGNTACLFDIAATGRVEIGVSTMQQTHTIQEIALLSQPIVCNPPCAQGACTSTNICTCPYGYEGTLCQNTISFDCPEEVNPCLNNGTCYMQVFNYYCNCTEHYTGEYCEIVDCGPPPSAIPPLLVISNISVAVYSCESGHALVGNDLTSICQEVDGTWSEIDAECLVDCGDLTTDSTELIIEYDNTLLGSIAYHSCAVNYTLIGASQRTCIASGQWSNQPPHCQRIEEPEEPEEPVEEVDCGFPPLDSVPHLLVTSTSTSLGSIATYTCMNGYVLQGSKYRTCQNDSTWSSVPFQRCVRDCGVPSVNTSGCLRYTFYNVTIEGAIFRYYCTTGCVLEGSPVSTCLSSGVWSGPPPKCLTLVDCGQPPIWNAGLAARYNSTTTGSIATYYCIDLNYELINGNMTAVCQENGQWRASPPICRGPPIDSTVYVVVGSTLGGVLLAIIIILIIAFVLISMNRFRVTYKVEEEQYQLSEI